MFCVDPVMFIVLFEIFKKIWHAVKNCGKWSDMVAVKLPEFVSWEIKLEKNGSNYEAHKIFKDDTQNKYLGDEKKVFMKCCIFHIKYYMLWKILHFAHQETYDQGNHQLQVLTDIKNSMMIYTTA